MKIFKTITALFPLWAILFSVYAYFYPSHLAPMKGWIVPLLGLVMFGMGMTLTFNDFRFLVTRPHTLAIGLTLQYLLMPLIAWLLAVSFHLPPMLAAGLILLGASPGGTASNVICYLARGDVALSIALTIFSTLCAPFLTPLLSWLYIGKAVTVPVAAMMISILKIIIVPVLAGIIINTLFARTVGKIKEVFPMLSMAAIVWIIAIIVAVNHDNLAHVGPILFAVIVIHNGLGLLTGYVLSRLLRLSESEARAIAIEVGMQNSGLSVALAIQFFSKTAALPGALFSVWHNLSGSFLALIWSRKDKTAG